MRKTIGVFIRNRPFFGAQITMLPALYYIRKNNEDSNLMLFGRHDLNWFYGQCDWVKSFSLSNNILTDILRFPWRCDSLFSFQPKGGSKAIIKIIKKSNKSIGFQSHKGLKEAPWDYGIPFNEKEYRALHYLKLASCKEQNAQLDDFLAAPFLHLKNQSAYQVERDSEARQISIMPGGGAGDFKKWGIDNFILLCQKLEDDKPYDLEFNFILGPNEENELKSLKKLRRNNIKTHYSLPLRDLSKVVFQSDLVISNDCGPSHIAQCLGKAYIGIYEKYKHEWFRPHSASRIITPEDEAGDIKSIQVEDVKKLANELLAHF